MAAGLAIGTMAVAAWAGSFAAAGADASGYLNHARLWKARQLHVCPEAARDSRAPESAWWFSPLGFRPAARPGCLVPTYPPGLPMLMGAAMAIGGEGAAFAVVPLTGALLVWATFALGRRLGSAGVGIAAAALVAMSPAFLYQLLQPMSDVPVAAWWTAAIVAALRRTPRGAIAAGLLASLAILTRPNLAPLAAIVGLLGTRGHAPGFLAGLVPGVGMVAIVNAHLYGGALASGYGSLSELYSWSYAPANLARYARWTIQTQSPLVFVGVLAPFVYARLKPGSTSDARQKPGSTSQSWLLIGFVTIVWASYVFYFVFEEWMYVRFLLPALPVMIVLSVMVLVAVFRRPRARALVAAGIVALGIWQVRQADARGVFTLRPQLARYEVAGRFAAGRLRAGAFIAGEHSGSLWYYTQQPVVRWDLIPPDTFDRTVDALRARGLAAHIVLDAWEVPRFRQRFAGASAIGALDWPATVEVRHRTRVRIFSVDDRARYLAGTTIRTRIIW
jgi:4-amino-4-deoxy-L-arabinose transferase-like glycosyltransferase